MTTFQGNNGDFQSQLLVADFETFAKYATMQQSEDKMKDYFEKNFADKKPSKWTEKIRYFAFKSTQIDTILAPGAKLHEVWSEAERTEWA